MSMHNSTVSPATVSPATVCPATVCPATVCPATVCSATFWDRRRSGHVTADQWLLGCLGRVGPGVGDTVARVDEHHPRLKCTGLGVVDLGVGDEDDQIPGMDQVGGGAVDTDHTAARLSGD